MAISFSTKYTSEQKKKIRDKAIGRMHIELSVNLLKNTTMLNMYSGNKRVSKYMKQKLTKL